MATATLPPDKSPPAAVADGSQVSFAISPTEFAVVRKIADRARAMERESAEAGFKPATRQCWQMDIVATHVNGNPLRLRDLLAADDFNFAHDVFGIARHLDRSTGKLTGFFSPRFSNHRGAA